MKKLIIFLQLFILFTNCSSDSSRNMDREKQSVQQLIEQYTSAFDRHDFVKFSSYCTEDMRFFTLDGQVFDREALVPFLNRILSHWNNMRTTIRDLEITVDSNIAWARYLSSIEYIVNDQPGAMNNLITVIFSRTDSGWRITHFHMSTSY
jgi:ketosteroid isomerase-like protein